MAPSQQRCPSIVCRSCFPHSRNSPAGSAVLPGIEALRRNPVPRPLPGITLRFGWGAESPSLGYSWSRVSSRVHAGLRVRIRLPPAASQVRTCLSREFAFLGREAAVFRGCPGRDERRGRQRHAGRGNIGPTGGNISVGPYSGTAAGDEVGDDAAWVSTKSGLFQA